MYLEKKKLSVPARIVLGLVGAAGAVYFALALRREGFRIAYIGYLLICSIMLVLAFSRGSSRPDGTVGKYRKYYLNRRASFRVDESGVELKLEDQRNYARSKFKEIYGLYDTDLCYYFVIKGKAFYILPKSALGDDSDALAAYMQKKCAKHFLHYDLTKPAS